MKCCANVLAQLIQAQQDVFVLVHWLMVVFMLFKRKHLHFSKADTDLQRDVINWCTETFFCVAADWETGVSVNWFSSSKTDYNTAEYMAQQEGFLSPPL